MMPQSQTADYSNGCNNNAVGIAVAPQTNQYPSNSSISGQISMLNSSVQNPNMMAATLHLNQSTQGYINPALATIGYIYPNNNNNFVQASNLVFNPHNIIHPPVEMMQSGPSSLGHIGSSGSHQNHKLSGYDNVHHFGSLTQNPSRKPKNSVMSKTNLYINGLQESDTDETVRALVEGIIDPKSCKAMMSHGKCRGSGFIDCANENDAETVIQILRNKQMPGGSRLAVKFAYENEKDDLNVYVRNLPRTSSFNNNNLEEMFKDYGQVVSVKLLQSDNQYTGTGFVRFSTAEEAQKAVDVMNMKKLFLTDEDKPVICKLADKGGRRINHTMIGGADSSPHQSQTLDSGDQLMNGTMSQLSSEGTDKTNYCMPLIPGHQYAPQGHHPWLNHVNADLLSQELQSLSLAQSANYLLPGVMQAPLAMPYNEEAAAVQQQQLLAQFVWYHQQQQHQQQQHNPHRIAANYHPSPVTHQQAQHLVNWPPVHHPATNNNTATNNTTNIYYGPDSSYQPMIYPPQQYRHTRMSSSSQAAINTAAIATLKSPSSSIVDPSTNGQSSSSNQASLMNGNVVIVDQSHSAKS